MKLEIKKIGNATAVIFPDDLVERLNIHEGEWWRATEGADRTLLLAPYDPDHEQALEVAREVMLDYDATFKALAK